MEKIKNLIKNHKIATVLLVLYILFMIWYAPKPDYKVFNSFSMSSSGGEIRDTHIKVVVYKGYFNKYVYKEIEEDHNKINGTPSKLTIDLYFSEGAIRKGKKPYRTVVFDYEEHIQYIELEY